jgi:cytochrome c
LTGRFDEPRRILIPGVGRDDAQRIGDQLNAIDQTRRNRLPRALKALGCPAVIAFSAFAFAAPCYSEPNAQAGKAFATANCSHCHSIDKFTPSPLAIAPPFRTLHKRYPVESLEEALAEGIVTGHPNMPEFKLDPGQIGDFISFLKSLEQ